MAGFNYANLSAVLSEKWMPEVVRTINQSVKTLASGVLPLVRGDGQTIVEDIEIAPQSATYVADGDNAPAAQSSSFQKASLGYALLARTISVGKFAETVGKLAGPKGGPAGLTSPFGKQMQTALGDMAEKINSDSFGGSGAATPLNIMGLDVWNAATGVVAGIDRAATASWRGLVQANGGAARGVSLALIDAFLEALYTQCGDDVVIGFCNASMFRQIGALFTKTYQQQVAQGLQILTLQGGYTVLAYNNCIFFRDRHVTAGQINFVNPKYCGWYNVVPEPDPDAEDFMVLEGTYESDNKKTSTPLSVVLQKLGPTGWKRDVELIIPIQFFSRKPNSGGILKDLTP